jgi:hypothetical protein
MDQLIYKKNRGRKSRENVSLKEFSRIADTLWLIFLRDKIILKLLLKRHSSQRNDDSG